jgi:hypothetical protein
MPGSAAGVPHDLAAARPTHLIGPDGRTVIGESLSVKNVFERVITSSLLEGVYTVEIHGYNVQSGMQDVHMVAITTP